MSSQVIDKALEIAAKRRNILEKMREAILAKNRERVFELARRLTGLSDEECRRTNTRLN